MRVISKIYANGLKRTFILYLSISIMLIIPVLFHNQFRYDYNKFKTNPITSILLKNNILKTQKEFPMPVVAGLVVSGAIITGFTLAEVLVTLAVIGVVASLTIAPLVKNYEKSQWVTGYKSTFTIVNQATRMIMVDNGGTLLNAWGGSHHEMYNAYLPYLKIAKKCENQNPEGSCFASNYTLLDNSAYGVSGTYSIILSSGTSLSFYNWGGTDTNGDVYLLKNKF